MTWYPLTSGADPVPGDPATDAVKVQAVKVAGDVERAHDRYASAGSALGEYADRLSDAQARASGALTEARSAAGALDDLASERRYRRAKLDEARSAASADPVTPGAAADVAAWQRLVRATEAEITVAETRLQRARDRVLGIQVDARRAADTARERIADVVQNDGLNPTFWEKVGQVALQVTKVLAQVSEWVAGIAGTLSFVLAFIPFLQPLAAVLATVALVAAAVNLLTTAILAATGEASLSDLIWSAVGLASFGAGKLISVAARTAAVRAVGTVVLEARSVAPEAGVTVRSLLGSPRLTKLSSTRAAAMQASRWLTQEAPLLPRVAADLRPSMTGQILAEQVGSRTALYDQLLRDLPPTLASMSSHAQAALRLSRLASTGVGVGVAYETLDTAVGVRASLEGATGSGYTLPAYGLVDLSWVDDSFDPVRSEAVLHLPSGS